MRQFFNTLKRLIIIAFVALFALYAILFVLLNFPSIQQKVKCVAEEALSNKLETTVAIENIKIEPFRKVALYNVLITDQSGDTLLHANKLLAGIKLAPLLQKRLIFNNIQLFGFDISINKENPDATPNYQFVLNAFTPQKGTFAVQLNNVVMRRGSLTYDILSEPRIENKNKFDKNHIKLNDILSTLSIKSITRDSTNVYIKRLSLKEQSGFDIRKLSLRYASNSSSATIAGLSILLPHSEIALDTLHTEAATTDSLQTFDSRMACDAVMLHIDLQDLAPLLPHYTPTASCELRATGAIEKENNRLTLSNLRIANGSDNALLQGKIALIGDIKKYESLYVGVDINDIQIDVAGNDSILLNSLPLSSATKQSLSQLGVIEGKAELTGYLGKMQSLLQLTTHVGKIESSLLLGYDTEKKIASYNGNITAQRVALNKIAPTLSSFQQVSTSIDIDASIPEGGTPEGKIQGAIRDLTYNGYQIDYINLQGSAHNNKYSAVAELDDPNGYLHLAASLDRSSTMQQLQLAGKGSGIDPTAMHLLEGEGGLTISFDSLYVNLAGTSLLQVAGEAAIEDITITSPDEVYPIEQLHATINTIESPQQIVITSDFANGYMKGDFAYHMLANSLQRMTASVFPAAIDSTKVAWDAADNNFNFELTVDPQFRAIELLHLPIEWHSHATLAGSYSDKTAQLQAYLQLPKMVMDSVHIDESSLFLNIKEGEANMLLTSNILSKKGTLSMITVKADASENRLALQGNWNGDSWETYCGEIRTETSITGRRRRDEVPSIFTKIAPTTFIVNDMVWEIAPASIAISEGNKIEVDGIEVKHNDQYIRINGTASPTATDLLSLSLQKIDLYYIFDIIDNKNIDFGGITTGTFLLSNLFDVPQIVTNQLYVSQFAYNECVMGDLTARSWWHPATKGVWIDGVISQDDYPNSNVLGALYFAEDSLHFNFEANHIDAKFLRPYVDDVFKDLSGYIYGNVALYGNFKAINIVGAPYAHDLTFGVEALNTTYSLSDTIRFGVNTVEVNNITLFDEENHTAKVRGKLTHNHFKNMKYDFSIYNANNLLVFDVKEIQNPSYYGKVYGSGTASITGNSIHTNFDVSLRTDANTTISFAPDNMLTNNDYQFITFVDRSAKISEGDESVHRSSSHRAHHATENSKYTMAINLQVDATPLANVRLVLDTSTGDVIRATGSGNLRLAYATNNDISLYGSYELEKGDYTFNLQDFVSKDFSISEGSIISFRGDPMQAELDINAIYTTTASLLDLDESFADESELTRTSIPVQTVLGISGDLLKPELAFGMEFPTLSQDLASKVNNIINTDDMLNRQIIYMLALGRFYTPNYVNSGESRSSELASVASSTLSSQLSNMLGQISETWNIGTSIRSDQGDFSDVEVELALSSQLLNNRLIFNGSFGYSETYVTSSSFIGDFDLEYLLNKSGNVRLKAYNHYNDRNYYTKSDLTTQGVGVLVKRDFNHFSEVAHWISSSISNTYNRLVGWIKGKDEEEGENNLVTALE